MTKRGSFRSKNNALRKGNARAIVSHFSKQECFAAIELSAHKGSPHRLLTKDNNTKISVSKSASGRICVRYDSSGMDYVAIVKDTPSTRSLLPHHHGRFGNVRRYERVNQRSIKSLSRRGDRLARRYAANEGEDSSLARFSGSGKAQGRRGSRGFAVDVGGSYSSLGYAVSAAKRIVARRIPHVCPFSGCSTEDIKVGTGDVLRCPIHQSVLVPLDKVYVCPEQRCNDVKFVLVSNEDWQKLSRHQKVDPLVFWWKWYFLLHKNQPIKDKDLCLWFLSLAGVASSRISYFSEGSPVPKCSIHKKTLITLEEKRQSEGDV